MIKIWSMKKNEQDAAAKKKPKTSAAQIRVQKDLTELDLPSTMKTTFPDPNDLLNFTLTITPDEGMYQGGEFKFSFAINTNYPHDPPRVKCIPKIYHPNVDLEGNVCLNILREDWKPVLNLTSVMVGLQYLFLEPNPDDPLNKEAAEDLKRNREGFIANVKSSMRGGTVKGNSFDAVLKKPEILCVLAGHQSSLFAPDGHITPDFLPLLHPGEVQTLETLVDLAARYARIQQAATQFKGSYQKLTGDAKGASSSSSTPSTRPLEYLSTLGAAISKVLKEYESLVVETEARVLRRDDELVGGHSFVPLSSIRAVFSIWDAPLAVLDSLVIKIYAGPDDSIHDAPDPSSNGLPCWPPGRLIDLLLDRAQTGVQRIAFIMTELAEAVQKLWRTQLIAFMIHGTLSSVDPLAQNPQRSDKEEDKPVSIAHLADSSSSTIHVQTISSLVVNEAAMPRCLSAATKESILYVGKAVAVVKAQGHAQKQIPRNITIDHAKMLGCVLPQDRFDFDRVISEIRRVISEFLWTHVLVEQDVEDAVESLADYFLLRNGEFALSLVREVERLKLSRLQARTSKRSGGIREQDMSLALLRASMGTTAQHDPSLTKLRFVLPTGPLPTFIPSASSNRNPMSQSLPQFSDLLIGTPLVLTYALEWPLDLFLVPSDLQIYSHLFAYFSSIRRAQYRVLECWGGLSGAQRSRMKWTTRIGSGTAQERLLRSSWSVSRQLLWFLDTLWGYLMSDVVGTQYKWFKAHLQPVKPPLEPRSSPSLGLKGRAPPGETDVGGEAGKKSRPGSRVSSGQYNPNSATSKLHLDFSTLQNLHATYLNRVLTGSLLTNATCAGLIREFLELSEHFVAQVERWGGDVLPALLSEGSLEDAKIGEAVEERQAIIKDINYVSEEASATLISSIHLDIQLCYFTIQNLDHILKDFYDALSASMSLRGGTTPGAAGRGGADASVLLNGSTILLAGLNGQTGREGSKDGHKDAGRGVEHILLRLDFNSALSKPNSRSELDGEPFLPEDLH
ncbi:hypothetical protein FRB98_004679 [Tulasnella sp. 332]|nr:hypothetical protein FRB98_004679 [Tulasnella sp. 332]